MASHIDPATGRNRRESGKLRARVRREKPGPYGGLRYNAGQPAEKRVTWRRRERVRHGR
jgi:hypothetical protein